MFSRVLRLWAYFVFRISPKKNETYRINKWNTSEMAVALLSLRMSSHYLSEVLMRWVLPSSIPRLLSVEQLGSLRAADSWIPRVFTWSVCIVLPFAEGAFIPLLTLMSTDREAHFVDVFSLPIRCNASCKQQKSFSLKSKHEISGQSKLIAPWLGSLLSE